MHVKFQHVLIHSWRNFCFDICSFSFFLFLFLFFFLVVMLSDAFFLVSALAEASDEVTDWRKWTRGNWVGEAEGLSAGVRRLGCILSGGESKTGAQWSSEEMGGPQCTSHSGSGNASHTELQLLFLFNLFYNTQYFLSLEQFVCLLQPQIRFSLWRQGLHFPHVPTGRPRSLRSSSRIFFLRPVCMACSRCCCPSEKSDIWEKVVREDFPQEIWVGSQRQKEQSPELTTQMRIQSWIPFHTLPVFFSCSIFFHFSMFYFIACI